jgi:hypothetical protein
LQHDPPASYFDNPAADQLPLLTYEYDPQTTVISRIGELGTRDMLVMAVLSQAFFANGCPADNKIHGDHATLGYIARQLGMHPEGATRLIRSSIERLSTARVKVKVHDVDKRAVGGTATTRGEVTVGFLANFGSRERKQKGVAVKRDNYIQLDQAMADLIRAGEFTFLRAEALRALRRQPLALKLYAWARTHRPDERGRIFYGVSRLAKQLGCSDQNSPRRRRKMVEARRGGVQGGGRRIPGIRVAGRADRSDACPPQGSEPWPSRVATDRRRRLNHQDVSISAVDAIADSRHTHPPRTQDPDGQARLGPLDRGHPARGAHPASR